MIKHILFIHGSGGENAFKEDGILVSSLQKSLGTAYEVHFPRMPLEESAEYADWKAQIAKALSTLGSPITLVGHSVGGAVLLKYLTEEQIDKPVAGLFLLTVRIFDKRGHQFGNNVADIAEDVADNSSTTKSARK